ASQAGKLAMEMYDKNGDGRVDGNELEQAPALKASLRLLDTDGDGAVSANEIAARVQVWKAMKTSLTGLGCVIKLDDKPLVGATVTFEPEAFLGDEVKPAIGTTNSLGMVGPSIPKEMKTDPKL